MRLSLNLRAGLLLFSMAFPGAGERLAAQGFVQQTLLVAPLHAASDRRLAQQVASRLRSRMSRLAVKRELRVLGGDTTEDILVFAGYKADTILGDLATLDLAKLLRSDEVVMGTVIGKRGGPVEVRAELAITRDWRLRQPLPPVKAATPAIAADSLAAEVVRARGQMAALRRCENAARESDPQLAAAEAARALRAYPRSTLARTCLAVALAQAGVAADSVFAVAATVLGIDSTNIVAAVIGAEALSSLTRRKEAAQAWTHVVNLRPDSLDLGLHAVDWMLRLLQPSDAAGASRRLLVEWQAEPRIRRLLFRAYSALADFPHAAALGDSLDASDPEFRDDSVFESRHITALRAVGDTLGAISKTARSVKTHPGDPLLYLEYVQLVSGENGAALTRALERFPSVPEFHVLAATSARTSGNATREIAALRDAIRLDSTMTRGYLRMAELWFASHRVDSALATLARTPRTGLDADLVRSYALGRGVQYLRNAADTTDDTWRTTIALFSLADSVESRPDTRSLVAAATLQLAQRQLVTASKSHECAATREASQSLVLADTAISRGVGEGANGDELRDAYTKLRTAADNFSKSLCR